MELSPPANNGISSPFAALIAMFYEPGKAFAALRQRRAAWLPLLLLMLCSAGLLLWYFKIVDVDWLLDQMFAGIKDVAQREKSRSVMSRQVLMVTGMVQALVGLPIMFALVGVYFMFIGKIYAKEFTFGAGFALAAWASVPALLTLPLGAIQILLASGGQLGIYELNPLSLNTLLFHRPMGDPMASLLESVNVISIWSAVLMVIGFQVWTRVARAVALKVVLIPYVIIYGAWLAFALSKAA
jgi:hypothetical protein